MEKINISSKKIVSQDIQKIFKNCKMEIDKLSGKNLLFTGPAGFIGYLFIQTLSKIGKEDDREPIKIYMIDNYIRGEKTWLNSLLSEKNIKLIKHDIKNEINFDDTNFDYIIHAASIASPSFYRKFPIETIDSNVYGTRNLLDLCLKQSKRNRIKGFLFFSSSEIYGDPDPSCIPTNEDYRGFVSCVGPRACVNFYKQHEIPTKIVRPFNNYGPGLPIDDKRVIPDFFKSLFNNESIKILSDGSAMRTFCYISDAIEGYIKVLVNGKHSEAYNIGNEKPEISVYELAKQVTSLGKKYLDYDCNIEYEKSSDLQYLTDNPVRRCPDITKAKEIGFEPSVDLTSGLEKTLFWYKGNL